MTLLDLVQKYKGKALFWVDKAVEGGLEFVVNFDTNEAGAIKDEIMSSEIVSFSATVETRGALPTITVLVKPAAPEKDPPSDDKTGTQTE